MSLYMNVERSTACLIGQLGDEVKESLFVFERVMPPATLAYFYFIEFRAIGSSI